MVGNWFWAEEIPPKMRRLMHRVGPDLQVAESPELWITIPSRPRLRVEIESVRPTSSLTVPSSSNVCSIKHACAVLTLLGMRLFFHIKAPCDARHKQSVDTVAKRRELTA